MLTLDDSFHIWSDDGPAKLNSQILGRASKLLNLDFPLIRNQFSTYPPFSKPYNRVLGGLSGVRECRLARIEDLLSNN